MPRISAFARRLSRSGALAAALAAGCGQGSGSASPVAEPPTASVAVPASGNAKVEALARCASAGERAHAKRAVPDEAYAELARGCADIYSAPECREAILQSANGPVGPSFPRIMRACRDAYCPRLPDPKPDLCTGPVDENNLGWFPKWDAFSRRVFAFEIGVPESELPRSLGAPVVDVPLEMPKPAATTATATTAAIDVGLDPKGFPIASVDRDGQRLTFSLPASPTAQDCTPVAQAAIKQGGAETRVVVRADQRVPHGTIIALLDALKQQGVTRIAFGVLPAP